MAHQDDAGKHSIVQLIFQTLRREKLLTHREFLEILKMMRDGTGDEAAPTAQDIVETRRGRTQCRQVIHDSSLENGMKL
jgi:hypothetical protein